MRTRWLAILALVTALGLFAPMATANQGKGKGHDKGNPHAAAREDHDRDGDDRWERRNGYEMRIFGREEGVPPGWSKGNKTGWGNCGLPPGQAKKYGCRTYLYGGRRYYWYRDDVGRIVVRRPRIDIHVH